MLEVSPSITAYVLRSFSGCCYETGHSGPWRALRPPAFAISTFSGLLDDAVGWWGAMGLRICGLRPGILRRVPHKKKGESPRREVREEGIRRAMPLREVPRGRQITVLHLYKVSTSRSNGEKRSHPAIPLRVLTHLCRCHGCLREALERGRS